jgi:hypothetical protein
MLDIAFALLSMKSRESGSRWGENGIHRDAVKTE